MQNALEGPAVSQIDCHWSHGSGRGAKHPFQAPEEENTERMGAVWHLLREGEAPDFLVYSLTPR